MKLRIHREVDDALGEVWCWTVTYKGETHRGMCVMRSFAIMLGLEVGRYMVER